MIPAQKQPLRYEGEQSSVYNLPLYEQVDIQKLIDEAYAAGERELTLPSGAYRIPPRDDVKAHLLFRGMEDFTINAYGVVFLYQSNRHHGMLFEESKNITINGLTSDFENLVFMQCRLEEIGPDRSYTVFSFDEGYGRFTQEDIDANETIDGSVYSSQTDTWLSGMEKMVFWLQYAELLDDGKRFRYNMPLTTTNQMQIGDYYCPMYVGNYPAPGINVVITRSGDIHLKDFTIWSSPISAIAESYGEGGSTYQNVRIVPGPKPYGATNKRVLSMSGDGFHLTALRQGPVIENSYFDSLSDDGINVHGIYAAVDTVLTPQKLIIANHGAYHYRAGDTLRFYDKGLNLIRTVKVKSAKEITDTYQPESPLEIRLFSAMFRVYYYFEVELLEPVSTQRADWVINADALCRGFTVRNCTFRNLVPRGVGVKTSDCVIENCIFEECNTAGIRITPEHDWIEGDYSQNIMVRNNVFRRCGGRVGNIAFGLSINGHEAIGHKNIIVENNLFEDNYNRDLHITCGQDIIVRNNTFGRLNPKNQMEGREHNPTVMVDRSKRVTFVGNTYDNSRLAGVIGPETEDITTDVPYTTGSWSNLYIQGEQGRGGWSWQYAPIGEDTYFDYPAYDYDRRGWFGEAEKDGCVTRLWWDTHLCPGTASDVVKTYTCPKDGTVAVGTVEPIKAGDLLDETDGVRVRILLNDQVVWPANGDWAEVKLFKPIPVSLPTFKVKKGDQLRFRVNKNQIDVGNGTSWAPYVYYLD